ncbi:hypothetical protein [Agrobacterium radiobacter]|uniref:hypothetical protein n=1 Tax=Agrobacterium radiobacter TaxID=362 RepID=UPI000DDF7C3D
MKASITDSELLRTINPSYAVAYLRARGWEMSALVDERFSVWHTDYDDEAEILIPIRASAPDFVSVMARTLKQLEDVEGRSQLEILRDLMNSGFDVVRIAAQSPATRDGTVRIEDGLKIFENSREMMLAAACAVVQPRPVFHSRKPQQATDFLRKARFGQTEVGSFVLTVLTPITPSLVTVDLFGNDIDEAPFERSVTETLARAVGRMVSAAETMAVRGFSAFQEAVKEGVSANLCEAVADLLKADETSTLKVDFAWAMNRPRPATKPIFISQSVAGNLEAAAKSFRATDTFDDYVVEGPVVKLQHEAGENTGRATILADLEGRARKVSVVLPLEMYNLAVEAHRNYRQIRLTGDVAKEGRGYNLRDPKRLEIVSDDEVDIFG